MRSCLFFGFLLMLVGKLCAQPWPGPAETPGSDAISARSAEIKSWATDIVQMERGWVWIEKPELGRADAGLPEFMTGPADGNICSLGDGGSATFRFEMPVINGPGPDFAIFENGFSDFFLELAKVSVSSDGVHFFTFPNFSETDVLRQRGPFDSLNAENIQGLAGKYRMGFGTPFDLEQMNDVAGLDIFHIQYVKVTDVIGRISGDFVSVDSKGRPINDPYPTPYPSSGFDLDAIAILHQQIPEKSFFVSPGLISIGQEISVYSQVPGQLRVFDLLGKCLYYKELAEGRQEFVFPLPSGIYLFSLHDGHYSQTQKVIFK